VVLKNGEKTSWAVVRGQPELNAIRSQCASKEAKILGRVEEVFSTG